jgi:hypothetical protein
MWAAWLRCEAILSPEERTLFSFNDFVFQAAPLRRDGTGRAISDAIDAMHHIDPACTAIAFFCENAIRWRSNQVDSGEEGMPPSRMSQ